MKRTILWVGRLVVIIVYAVLLAYAVIVGMAFVLKLLGANPQADFAEWVYRAAANITEPFRGIFPTTELAASNRSVFDASLLFALMVYLLAAVVIHAFINWLTRQITGIDREKALEQQLELQRQQAALGLSPLATTTMPAATVTPGGTVMPAATEPVPTTWAEPAPAAPTPAAPTPWPPESSTATTTSSDPPNPPTSANP